MIAAVTLCAPILLIIMSIACVFGMGGSSVIARLYLACMVREGKKGNQLVPLRFKGFVWNAPMIRNVVSIGIPGALITVLMSVSNIVLNNYIGIYGSDVVASYG